MQAVQPTPEQSALLDEMRSAAAKAADVFKGSCSDSYAMTPPGRLRAMTNRISATLEAVRIVRPALEKFYNSLSDEQQARFNALGPNIGERSQQQPQQDANAQSDTCGDPKSSLTNLPIERIETVIRPAGTQKEALDRLSEATAKAVQGLQAACPDDVPLTPVGRLEAITITLKLLRRGWWPSLLAYFDPWWPILIFALAYFCKVAARPNSVNYGENIPGCEQFCTDSP